MFSKTFSQYWTSSTIIRSDSLLSSLLDVRKSLTFWLFIKYKWFLMSYVNCWYRELSAHIIRLLFLDNTAFWGGKYNESLFLHTSCDSGYYATWIMPMSRIVSLPLRSSSCHVRLGMSKSRLALGGGQKARYQVQLLFSSFLPPPPSFSRSSRIRRDRLLDSSRV